jgi:DNA-binding PadR family transcriptional regulator
MSGVPELLLLRLLEQKEMYGYELVRSLVVETA